MRGRKHFLKKYYDILEDKSVLVEGHVLDMTKVCLQPVAMQMNIDKGLIKYTEGKYIITAQGVEKAKEAI